MEEFMKAKKTMAVIAALTAALTMTALPFASVSADTGKDEVKAAEKSVKSNKLKITGLKKPAQGRNLDRDAIASYNGKEWRLIVNWTQGKNTPSIKAEAGKKYRPYITFWVPEELNAEEVFAALEKEGYFPEFLKNPLVIKEKYSTDDGSVQGQIWYITADPIKCERTTTGSAGAAEGIGEGGGTAPESASGGAVIVSGGDSAGFAADLTSDDDDDDQPQPENTQDTDNDDQDDDENEDVIDEEEERRIQEEEEEYERFIERHGTLEKKSLRTFCLNDDSYNDLVAKYGEETLQGVVDEIRFILEPQAVNLLIDKIPAFRDGSDNEQISGQIGFLLDENSGGLGSAAIAWNWPEGASEYTFYHRFMISPSSIFEEENGTYTITDSSRTVLEHTLTHEMTHAFMQDYTRSGMVSENVWEKDEQGRAIHYEIPFPDWFAEGTASTCDDCFGYRRSHYITLATDTDSENYNMGDADLLIFNYADKDFNITDTKSHDGNNPYVMGYLACLYLYDLAYCRFDTDSVYTSVPEKFESNVFCTGFSDILIALHSGETLDDIIAAISPLDDNGDPIYANTAEFEQKFMTFDDNKYSAEFCAAYLDYLNHLNPDGNIAGNILLDLDHTDSPFLTQEEVFPAVFTMTGEQHEDGFIESDVEGAYIGGGTSAWDPNAHAAKIAAIRTLYEKAEISEEETDEEELLEEEESEEEEDTEEKDTEEEADEEQDIA